MSFKFVAWEICALPSMGIVATDFYPSALDDLAYNMGTNLPDMSSHGPGIPVLSLG